MAILGIPTLTIATYLVIILLFVVGSLYVGMRFEPLTEDEIQAKVEEAKNHD